MILQSTLQGKQKQNIVCSSGYEITALELDWGFILKLTVTFQIPTSVFADAVSNQVVRN